MEAKNMDLMKKMDNLVKIAKIVNKMRAITDIMYYTRHTVSNIELEYAMALDIADMANIDIIEVLEFVKKLSAETKYTYEECIEYARKYFVSGDYKIYSPDKYSLLVSQNYLFVIPSIDNEPTKLIKMA